jgi:8-oxo-dGTP diphosphatase
MQALKLLLVVAAALVDANNRVLIAQRPQDKHLAGLWEFPGGKLVRGERPEDALVRELAEELGITVQIGSLEPFSFASHPYEDFHLLMPLYLVRRWEGLVAPSEGQAIKWARASELGNYPMPPADLPLIAPLAALLG